MAGNAQLKAAFKIECQTPPVGWWPPGRAGWDRGLAMAPTSLRGAHGGRITKCGTLTGGVLEGKMPGGAGW